MNWPLKLRQKTAKMLEFDADNPMILLEMSRILANGAANNQGDITPFIPNTFELKENDKKAEKGDILLSVPDKIGNCLHGVTVEAKVLTKVLETMR